jgi:phosphoglycolate phosphatase
VIEIKPGLLGANIFQEPGLARSGIAAPIGRQLQPRAHATPCYNGLIERPTRMKEYRLLIFDFDGTLADSGAWLIRTYNALAGELGTRPIVEDQVQALRSQSTREIMAQLNVPMWKVPRIATRIRAAASAQAEEIKLFPGVDALLPKLKQHGIQLAIVSSNSEVAVRRVLGTANIACIDVFNCSASIFGKAPKLRAVMKRTGIAPEHTLCVGDEVRDIEAARQAIRGGRP